MRQTHKWMFYMLTWRVQERNEPYSLPRWGQPDFRHWLEPGDAIGIRYSLTVFGREFVYSLSHYLVEQRLVLSIKSTLLENTDYVYPSPFRSRIPKATSDAGPIRIDGLDVRLPARTTQRGCVCKRKHTI